MSTTRERIVQYLPGDIEEHTTFAELGMDSLDTIELVDKIEHEFGVKVPNPELKTLKSVGDIEQWLHRNQR